VGLPLAHAFSAKYEVVGFDLYRGAYWELKLLWPYGSKLRIGNHQDARGTGQTGWPLPGDSWRDRRLYYLPSFTVPTPIDSPTVPDLSGRFIRSSEKCTEKYFQKGMIIGPFIGGPTGSYSPGVNPENGVVVPGSSEGGLRGLKFPWQIFMAG